MHVIFGQHYDNLQDGIIKVWSFEKSPATLQTRTKLRCMSEKCGRETDDEPMDFWRFPIIFDMDVRCRF